MNRIIVFDVNETLLDLRALRTHFERVFTDANISQQWFSLLLHSSMASTLAGKYSDFGALGKAALEMVAVTHGVALADSDREVILSAMQSLPPHGDVKPGLERLRAAGFRLATLTNSSYEMLKSQMMNAGLLEAFDAFMSVDEVRKFKPALEVYQMAAEKLGVAVHQIRMVAAHDWDVFGALQAGCAGAFIARGGKPYHPLYTRPDVIGANLEEVVEQILQVDGKA